jgi:hypothetical protein
MVIPGTILSFYGHMNGPTASMREMRNTKIWPRNLKGTDHFEDLDIDMRIRLEWILK